MDDTTQDGQPESGQVKPEAETLTRITVIQPREHMEATCIAFTKVYSQDGSEWSLTLREGITSEQLDRLLLAMQYTGKVGEKHGFRMTRADAQPAPPLPATSPVERDSDGRPAPTGTTPPKPAQPTKSGAPPPPTNAPRKPQAEGLSSDWEPIFKVVVNPNAKAPENPRVELWGKPVLQYPVSTAPASLIAGKLAEAYDMQVDNPALAWLFQPGGPWGVEWKVKLVDSEKLNQKGRPYRNIAELIDLERERR